MTSSHPITATCQWFSQLARPLDPRSAPRLALLFLGALLARGRRTVTSWIRAAKLGDQFQPAYTAVASAGKNADSIAANLALDIVKPLVAKTDRLTLALDETRRTDRGRMCKARASTTTRPRDPPARPMSTAMSSSSSAFWSLTMTEMWAWGRKEEELVDRSASPWDKGSRRPSHAEKRRAWRRELLGEEIRAVLRCGATEAEIQTTANRLLSLAA